MADELELLEERVAALEQKVAEVASYLQSAFNYVSSDPQSSLTKSRMTLEKLLLTLHRQLLRREPRKPMIAEMLNDKEFGACFPRRLLSRMHSVRDMSNLGAHVEEVDASDAIRVLRDLIEILEWYEIDFDPGVGRGGTQEPGGTIEILPELESKYPHQLRPEIISVRFVQARSRCYLEVTKAELVAGYQHKESTKQEDLAFILDSDLLSFNPQEPVEENAQKFVSEIDEMLIIHCTDLFTPEASRICEPQLVKPDEDDQLLPCRDWAAKRWQFWETQNRFAISPIRRAHAIGEYPQDVRDHYAALFSLRAFDSISEFFAYEFFHASVLQTVVRDTPPDDSWFVLDGRSHYVERLCGLLTSKKRLESNQDALMWLNKWELPSDLKWLHELEYEESLVKEEEDDTDANFWSRTKQGYLVLLVING